MCGAAAKPSARNASTVSSVPSRVEPPAPNVTEQYAGASARKPSRTMASLRTPSGVRGGKNSRLTARCCRDVRRVRRRRHRRFSRMDDSAHEMML